MSSQLSIFAGEFIDARVKKPEVGQKIICYLQFDGENVTWSKPFFDVEGRQLVGPQLTTYERFFEDGTYRPLAYWLPCPLLT